MTSNHILLEQLDEKKDWQQFKLLLNTDERDYLLIHLQMTRNIFHWNFHDLSKEEQNKILYT
jgi:hypothetical protein